MKTGVPEPSKESMKGYEIKDVLCKGLLNASRFVVVTALSRAISCRESR